MEMFLNEKWNFLKIDNNAYIFKFVYNESEYNLLLFNLAECLLYREKRDYVDIGRVMAKLNSSIEAPLNKMIQHLYKSLTDTSTSKFEFIRNGY